MDLYLLKTLLKVVRSRLPRSRLVGSRWGCGPMKEALSSRLVPMRRRLPVEEPAAMTSTAFLGRKPWPISERKGKWRLKVAMSLVWLAMRATGGEVRRSLKVLAGAGWLLRQREPYACATSAASARVRIRSPPPLSEMADRKRREAWGMAMRAAVALAPADSPPIVTRAGSPPKAAMLWWTHSSEAMRSR